MQKINVELPSQATNENVETTVYVLQDGNLMGCISLTDEIREESYEAVKILKEKTLNLIMAIGDSQEVAKSVSKSLNLNDNYAEVLPKDKHKIFGELQKNGEIVAMTGNGVNDAPTLAKADVEILIDSGTDVAVETADIILVNSNPMDILHLLSFGKSTY